MSPAKRIVTVFGATGDQGGSVAATLLRDGVFAVRAVTRNAGSSAARDLAAAGAEVVEADQTDVQSVSAALKSAYAVFAVTSFW